MRCLYFRVYDPIFFNFTLPRLTKILLFFCSLARCARFIMREINYSVNKCPTRCNYTQFILSVNCSTRFGCFLQPSSRTQIAVNREERKPTRCNNIDDLLSIVDVDY